MSVTGRVDNVRVPAETDIAARERAADALARGSTQTGAAKASGYARMTIYRLLREPAFVALVEKRRAELAAAPPAPAEPGHPTAEQRLEQALEVLRAIAAGELDGVPAPELRMRLGAAKAIVAHAQVKKGLLGLPPRPSSTPAVKVVAGGAPKPDGAAAAAAWLDGLAKA